MMPPPPQMVPLWRLWLHAASERARAASQRTARARWGGDRATRSTDGSGDGTGVGSGVGSVVGSGVGSAVGSAVGSGDGSGVGSVDGSGIGRVVGSAAESDGGSGVVSRVSSEQTLIWLKLNTNHLRSDNKPSKKKEAGLFSAG